MEHQIPQFIEIEDKIIGPLSLKQFVYVGGSLAIGFLLWSILPRIVALFTAVPIMAFGMGLAFYKYNGRPLVVLMENAFNYLSASKLYIWRKQEKKPEKGKRASDVVEEDKSYVPRLSGSKLREITWSLDINEHR